MANKLLTQHHRQCRWIKQGAAMKLHIGCVAHLAGRARRNSKFSSTVRKLQFFLFCFFMRRENYTGDLLSRAVRVEEDRRDYTLIYPRVEAWGHGPLGNCGGRNG